MKRSECDRLQRSAAMPEPAFRYAPPDAPLKVIHADRHVLVISKPVGLLSVPGRGEHLRDCVAVRARERFPEARIVHRLDLDTSGIMVLGLGAEAHRRLSMQFEARRVDKSYIALVWGCPAERSGRIELPLSYDPPNKPRQKVDFAHGRPAVTEWEVIGDSPHGARLRLEPLTGRSHQLRVHMAALGHPILGDPLYADGPARAAATRLCLHAETLAFDHPAHGRRMCLADPCPF